MSEPSDGPWDDATSHDDPQGPDAQMTGDDQATIVNPNALPSALAQRARSRGVRAATAPGTLPPPTTPDRLPALPVQTRTDATTGGHAIVATGSDADRVRKLCHTQGLLVPVMASLSVVHEAVSVVVIGEPSPPAPERVVHVVRATLDDEALVALLRALVGARVVVDPPVATDVDESVADFAKRIVSIEERGALETLGVEAITAATSADRAQLLFHDPSTGALWSEARRGTTGDDRRSTWGIAGWCAHTGQAVHASPAGDDARYVTGTDDPDGKPQSRLLVQPVIGADRRVHAVLVAARRWRRSDFTDQDRANLVNLAALIAPTIDLAAAGAAQGQRPRSTRPGIAAQALVTAPRRTSDSRPPPVTARREDSKVLASPAPPVEVAAPTRAPTATPAVPTPTVASPSSSVKRAPTEPSATTSVKRAPTEPSPTSVNRAKRATGDKDDPRDLAIVATDDEDVARARKLAKKARLEISILSRAEDAPPYYRIVTIGQPWTPETDPRVVYAARTTLADDHLVELLVGLATDRAPAPLVATKPQSAAEAKRTQVAFERSRQVATAVDLVQAETIAITAVRELVDADRAYCLHFDHEAGTLWSEARKRSRGDDRRAIAGVVGWAARTGRAVNVPRASGDPRWLGPLDDADGDPNSQLLVQPIINGERRVIGVLVAVRRAKRPGFSELDVSVLARFAALVAPLLEQITLAVETQTLLREGGSTTEGDDLRSVESPVHSLMRRAQSLPRWTYAAAGAAVMLVIVLIASC